MFHVLFYYEQIRLKGIINRPRKKKKKRDFSWQKPWGHFLKTVISLLNKTVTWEFHKIRKSVIYRDQKSKKLPNDRHNERSVVRIFIENGAEISDNSVLAWHCATGTFLNGCFKLTRLSL